MRSIGLLLAAGVLSSCVVAPETTARSARAQSEYEHLIAGKVVGPPQTCLASYRNTDMIVIDERTIAYREGGGRVYVNHMRNACYGLGGRTALITRTFGSPQTCSGDIAQVADLTSRITVGSCVFGEFTPYSRPPR